MGTYTNERDDDAAGPTGVRIGSEGNSAPLSTLGERELIRRLIPEMPTDPDQLPLGDDCGGIAMGDGYLLVSTDTITSSTHLPTGSRYYSAGWHIVAINLSDLAAKGARPLGLVIAMGLPPSLPLDAFSDIVAGIRDCARRNATPILGGDTKSNPELTLTGTSLGWVEREKYLPRHGAIPGDLVCVTGTLGHGGYGLAAAQCDDSPEEGLQCLLEVQPRLGEGRLLAQSGVVHASMDLSDGLALSLHQLASASEVGLCIRPTALPVYPPLAHLSTHLTHDPLATALYDGGDYELLFTLDPHEKDALAAAFKDAGQTAAFTVIGETTQTRKVMHRTPAGKWAPLPARGYEHLR